MNPKDIGKKDWEIKQEFLKSNPMSQEEEKLIEEFKKTSEGKYYSEVGYKMWHRDILKAFRSGKLVGFEVCEKLISQKNSIYDFPPLIFRTKWEKFSENISENMIKHFKSLIEEEKKKL